VFETKLRDLLNPNAGHRQLNILSLESALSTLCLTKPTASLMVLGSLRKKGITASTSVGEPKASSVDEKIELDSLPAVQDMSRLLQRLTRGKREGA
jgi:hypothetical protein